ncbi:dihydrolipoyl dehydrogenase [Acrasis kona]|uniref:Dihydrolipoyl dehydrogenase n=1 Tax=Acrasis kona TaxID=1008807 RepID=A0AAW2ZL86_9EUKA
MATKHYDVIVIGAGAGLPKLGSPASRLGLKVALLEKGRLGGTCLNRGCIPSKMLIHPADVALNIDEAHRFEVNPQGGYTVDFTALIDRVSKTIDEDSFSINPRIEANEMLDWYKEPAKFVDKKTLKVGDQIITGDKIFIAAGSRPTIPKIKGLDGIPYMTSTEALRHNQQPKKLIVIGAGYIACELAHFYASLGTEVFIFVRSTPLRHVDEEVRDEFLRVFKDRKNINLLLKCSPEEIKYEDKVYTATYVDYETKETKTLQSDALLVAVGVVPNTDLLEVEKSGIEIKEGNFIKVDDHLRTNVPGVWALGDIAGNYLFRHSANYEGEYLLETILYKGEDYPIDYTGMPWAVFTNPQIAGVGYNEEELKKKEIKYVKGVNPYSSSAMGMALRSDHGFVKILVERYTRKLLGCIIVGHEASTLIHEVIPLFRLHGTLDDILKMIHIHPALSELVRNAARKARDELMKVEEVPLSIRFK